MVAKSRSGKLASIIVLLLTIVLGTLDISTFTRHIGTSQIVLIACIVITIILAVLMLIKRNENLAMNLAVFGLMCSLFIMQEGLYAFENDDLLRLSFAVVECFIGGLGIYLNLLLYIGNRYNQTRLSILAGVAIVVLAIPIMYEVAFEYVYLWDALIGNPPNTIDIMILILYIALLMHPDVLYHTVKMRINFNANAMNDSLFVEGDACMYRDQFLLFIDDSVGWEVSEQPGVSEIKRVTFFAYGHGAELIMKRCDDGEVYLTLISDSKGTHMHELSFPMRQLTYEGDGTDCDMFTVYGDPGYFIKMVVKDERMVSDNRFVRFYHWMTGY